MRRFALLSMLLLAAVPTVRATAVPRCGPPQWQIVPTANHGAEGNELLAITAVSRTDAWTVGEGVADGHTIAVSMHWDGTGWVDVPIPEVGDASGLLGVGATSSIDVWAVGYSTTADGQVSRALIQHWDGTGWEVVDAPLPDPSPNVTTVLTDVLAFAPDDAWAVGRWAPVPDAPPSPLIMHWDGTGWEVVNGPEFERWTELTAVAGSGPEDIWFVGNTEIFVERKNAFVERGLIEHWDGDTFTVLSVPFNRRHPLNPFTFDDVVALSPANAWAVGSLTKQTGTSVNLIHHWDGQAWTRVDVPSPSDTLQYLSGATALTREKVWAVGRYQGNRTGLLRTFVARWRDGRWRQVTSENRRNDSQLYDVTAVPGWKFAVGSSWTDRDGGRYRTLGLERCAV